MRAQKEITAYYACCRGKSTSGFAAAAAAQSDLGEALVSLAQRGVGTPGGLVVAGMCNRQPAHSD
jgi:hypothetical protein